VTAGPLGDWHEERKFRILNEKEERVKVICSDTEHVINVSAIYAMVSTEVLVSTSPRTLRVGSIRTS